MAQRQSASVGPRESANGDAWRGYGRRQLALRLLLRYMGDSIHGRRFLCEGGSLGETLRELQSLGKAVGVEPAPETAARLRGERFNVLDGSLLGTPPPLPPGAFDAVLIDGAPEPANAEALLACLRRCAELLRPGGYCVFSAPTRVAVRLGSPGRAYKRGELRSLFEGAGYQVRLLSRCQTLCAPAIFAAGGRRAPAELSRGLDLCLRLSLAAEARILPWLRLPGGMALIAIGRVGAAAPLRLARTARNLAVAARPT